MARRATRWAGCAGLALAMVAAGGAAETTRDPSAGGLSAAKSDYEAIKAAGAGREQQQLAMPTVPPIELKADDPGATALPLELQSRKKAAEQLKAKGGPKSANWLLEAMEEQKARERGEDPDTHAVVELPATARPPAADDFLQNAREIERAGAGARQTRQREAIELTTKAEAGNPLTAFMAGWMTPQDFELLAPGSAGAGSRLDPVPPAPAPAAPGAAAPSSGADLFGGGPGPTPPAGPNPYLASLPSFTPPPPSTPAVEALLPSFFAAPALAPADPVEAPPARSTTPAEEFRNAPKDDKYFKQLKRF